MELLLLVICIGGLFACANIPVMIGRTIIQRLVFQDCDLEQDAETLCRKKLRCMEWIHFYPLKKVLIGGMWLFLLAVVIMGVVMFQRESGLDNIGMALLSLVIAVCTAPKVWRYITTPYYCVPVINQVLSKKQIQSLIQGERFEPVSFEYEELQKYTPILVSENWGLIEGLLISKKLVVGLDIHDCRSYTPSIRRGTRMQAIYLNGEIFETPKTSIIWRKRVELKCWMY